MSTVDDAIFAVSALTKIAESVTRMIALGTLSPEDTAELEKLRDEAEARLAKSKARWESLAPAEGN